MIKTSINVVNWANDRNLIRGSTPQHQFVKLVEEFGELAAALARGNMEEFDDSVGDIMVVMEIMCAQLNRNPIDMHYRQAYEVIKNRRGRMVDGVFIKEEDEQSN